MIGTYHKTLARDEKSGFTYFLFCVKGNLPQANDGVVTCYGKIHFVSEHIPLSLTGSFRGTMFYFSDYSPYGDTETLLHYFISEMPEKEKKAVCQLTGDDLFGFCRTSGAEKALGQALSSFEDGGTHAKTLVNGIRSMMENKEIFSLFSYLGISYPLFERVSKAHIPLSRLKRNPFLPEYGLPVLESEKIMAYYHPDGSPYNPMRIKGYILDALLLFRDQGDTCCTFPMLCKAVKKRTQASMYPEAVLTPSLLFSVLKQMDGKCYLHTENGQMLIFLQKIWDQESSIASHAARLEASKTELIPTVDLSSIEKRNGFSYNQGQREAFQLLRSTGIKLVVGPPGSGKTALLNGLEMAYKDAFPDETIVSLATTGAAAQVIKKSTGRDAETIHKCLGLRPMGQRTFSAKDINHPIEARFIIVDEVSMLDMETCAALLPAIKSGALLLLVGDADQLQSVSYGDILSDFIASGLFEVYRLTEVMRQTGTIYQNARKIRKGDEKLIASSDFRIYRYHDADAAIQQMFKEMGNKKESLVLSPVKGGELGVYHLNKLLQDKTQTPVLRYGDTIYRQGDRIIMTETNYQKGYFNGDMGEIIERKDDRLFVRFEQGQTFCLDRDDYPKMMLAYAVTVHKSQGSEQKDIHVLLPATPCNMLTRRLLYTAVTRAKEKVVIYYIDDALSFAIGNTAERKRMTYTTVALKNGFAWKK